LVEGIGEKLPQDHAAKEKYGIRYAFGRYAGDIAKEEAVDHGDGEGLQHHPRQSQRTLLVANLEVSPDEDREQCPKAPELHHIERLPALGRRDDLTVYFGHGARVNGGPPF
jgi:hypothetical protein